MATVRGGDRLEKKLAEVAARLKSNPGTLRVGFLENATYPDGTPVALVAAVQDGGAPSRGIPPRPFFRNAIRKNQKDWPKELVMALVHYDYDADKALNAVGVIVEDQIKNEILVLQSPRLKEGTIRRKGFSKPLIHHSVMINSVHHDIKR